MSSAGAEAVALAGRAGLVLDPWQAFALEVMLGERADGRWSAFEVGVLVARQNGKGAILEARALAGLFLFGERLIVWSAHEFKTAKEAYLRVKGLIEACPDLHRRVKRRGSRVVGFRQSNEDTSIELESGQRLRFMARSKGSGRGFTGDTQILDEAQELPGAAVDAMMPTLSARPNPQLIYTGTVPSLANDGAHFERVRDRGREGGDPSLAWLEWSPDPGEEGDYSAGVDLDDPAVWAASNPGLGFRLTAEAIVRERASMSDEGFARERCSVWVPSGGSSVIDLAAWAELAGKGDEQPSPIALAVSASGDRERSFIGLAGRRPDGRAHLQVVRSDPGTAWVIGELVRLKRLYRPVDLLIDGSDPGASLVPDMRATRGLRHVNVVGSRDVARATGMLIDAVKDGSVTHGGGRLLTMAVENARLRRSGDLRVFAGPADGSVDVAPLKAVALALLGLRSRGNRSSDPSSRRAVVM